MTIYNEEADIYIIEGTFTISAVSIKQDGTKEFIYLWEGDIDASNFRRIPTADMNQMVADGPIKIHFKTGQTQAVINNIIDKYKSEVFDHRVSTMIFEVKTQYDHVNANYCNNIAFFDTSSFFRSATTINIEYQTATSSGDPYVTTFSGHKYKIPNKNNIYRMFQYFKENEKVIINASVSQLTNSEKEQLLKISNDLGIKNPILNGYYYDKFYISYNDKYIVFNRNIEIIDTNIDKETKNLNINYDNKVKEFNCPIQGKSVYKSIFINIYNTRIELQKILHPQILNGINVNYSGDTRNVKGIFNTNKHPKNYVIKKINSDIELKCKKEREYNRIEKENWIEVN